MGQPNYAGNIIVNLANLPEFLRKPILQKRLAEFFSMSDEDKKEIINKVSKNFDESSEEEIYNDSKDEVINIKSLLKEKQSKEKMKLVALKESSNKSESLLNQKRKK